SFELVLPLLQRRERLPRLRSGLLRVHRHEQRRQERPDRRGAVVLSSQMRGVALALGVVGGVDDDVESAISVALLTLGARLLMLLRSLLQVARLFLGCAVALGGLLVELTQRV